MRRLALTIALACVLSGVVRAGEMHPTGAVASPTPSPVSVANSATVVGEIPTTDATTPQPSDTLLTVILTIISIIH